MGQNHTVRAVKALKIHCPIDGATWDLPMARQLLTIDHETALGRIMRVIREHDPLGDFDSYRSVIEMAPGWELFTPTADARPTLGEADAEAASPTAILTVYIPAQAPADAVSRAIDAIVAAHPWEVPVIEIADTFLVVRA